MDGNVKRKRDVNPGQNANILSKITFFFAIPIFQRSFKNLREADVYGVITHFSSKTLGDMLESEWEIEKKKSKPLLFRSLFKIFGLEYVIWGFAAMIVNTTIMVIKPLLIGKIISYFSPKQTLLTKDDALIYAVMLITCIAINALFSHRYMFVVMQLALKVRVACSTVIYRKTLKQSTSFTTSVPGGHVVTLLTKDTMIFDSVLFMVHFLLIGALQLVVMTYVMYKQIGVAAIVGVSILLLFIPFQAYLGSKTTSLRLASAKQTDERIRLTQELLSTIRVIKMYTWELFFSKAIDVLRKKEIHKYRILTYIKAICRSLGLLNVKISLYITIVTYVALGNHVTAEKAFVVTGCFGALYTVLAVFIPLAFLKTGELIASLKRIMDYLSVDEVYERSPVKRINEDKSKVSLQGVKVTHRSNVILNDITIKLKSGVTLITGPIGSGKSTLLRVILGDVHADGVVEVSGNVSYASQEPWLFPGTIRKNIIFNEPFDKERYESVVRVCALRRDFESLCLQDETFLTDKGLNLSKGQQARINLARAIYKPADVYLLDDCLSSVDLKVAKHIFYECLKKFLNNKACLLVSHQHRFLQDVDDIMYLRNGHLQFHGMYEELKNSSFVESFDEYGVVDDFVDTLVEDSREKVCNELENIDECSKLLPKGDDKSAKNIYSETNEQGSVGGAVYRKYLSSGGILLFLLVIVLAILAQGTRSLSDYFVRFWVDSEQKLSDVKLQFSSNSTEHQRAEEANRSVIYQYSLVILGVLVFTIMKSIVFYTFSTRASIRIHRLLIDKIVNATMVFFDTNLAGNVINRLSRDFSVADEHLPSSILESLQVTLMLIGILIVVSTVNTWFLLPSGVFALILYFGCCFYVPSGRNIRRIEGSSRSPVIGHMQATFDGITTIRACQAQNIVKDEFDDHHDVYNSSQYMHLVTTHAFGFYMDIFSTVYIGIITFSLLLFDHDTGASKVGLALTQSFALIGLLQWCIYQWCELEMQMTSVERVLEYTTIESESKSGSLSDEWPKKGKIVYKNVLLRYSLAGELVLNNVSFTIEAREKIGIVGRTGAGKSSIIATLFRLYKFDGTVTVDDVNINTLQLRALRSKISIIPQDPILFSGTIRTNLDPDTQYSDRDIWSALDEVEMREQVTNLDQIIADNGSNFSIGQKQLICLARAILQNNLIIVLDEATANVDTNTDLLIQRTIRRIFVDRTIIIIAHRLHTIMDCDKVLVMDSGIAIEYAHPKSLLNSEEGVFYGMVKEAGLLHFGHKN